MERYLKITGHLFFLAFFIFSILLSCERVLFTDSAYYLFKIINYEQLNVEYSRFPAIFTQLLTWLGVKLGLPVSELIVIFSASFVAVYYVIFLIAVYVYRNVAAGIAMAFVLCLSARHSFFHIVTETHQALIFSCLFFAWLMAQKDTGFFSSWNRLPNLLVGVLIVCFAGYSHPVAYIAIAFCIVYFVIDRNSFDSKLAYVMLAIAILMGAFKYFTTPSGSYEGQFLSQIALAPELLLKHSSLYSKWFYDFHYEEMYRIPLWMTLAVSVYYLLNSKFLKFLFVPAFYFGFVMFAKIVFNAGDSRVMMERAFMPLAFFAAIPFLNDLVAGSSKFKIAKTIFIVLLLAFSMRGIYQTSGYFSDRIRYMDQFFAHMDANGSHKMLIDWKTTTHNLVYIPWAFGVETLLYSCTKEGGQKTVFVYDKIEELNFQRDGKNVFLCVHFDQVWDDSRLNTKYFNLQPEIYFVEKDSILFQN